MTRKTLSFKVKRNKDSKSADEVVNDVVHSDPLKRFMNEVAVNPS